MFCRNCGATISDNASFCDHCGTATENKNQQNANQNTNQYYQQGGYEHKSKLAAGLLAILLPFGIHSFYLGETNKGIAQLLLFLLCGVGAIWSWIEGILIFAGSINKDANGQPLKD